MSTSTAESQASSAKHSRYWNSAALVIFACAAISLFHPYWDHDLTKVVPSRAPTDLELEQGAFAPGKGYLRTDTQFVIWLISRNAYTFLTAPHRLFEAETCYPAPNSLALGEPGVTVGIIGMPAYLLTRDPLATFNMVALILPLIAAFAMYLLVRDWTGVPAAGIVAALLYAFHEIRLGDIVHLYGYDNAWTVFALFFARRLFAQGRWRDALGLAWACAFQIGGSLYPLAAAAFLSLPFLVWLCLHYGLRRQRVGPWAALLGIVLVVTYLVLGPFLEVRGQGILPDREYQLFWPLAHFSPGHRGFPGWGFLLLVVLGLTLGRRRALAPELADGRGDLRWTMLVSALLILSLSVAGLSEYAFRSPDSDFPSLYNLLARFIPGLGVVRAPGALCSGFHLALSIVAGFGAASLLRAVPQRSAIPIAVALILLAYVDTLRPAILGMEPRIRYDMFEMRPKPDGMELIAALRSQADGGPILDVPINPKSNFYYRTEAILRSAYTHRPTSACYNSFVPPTVEEVRALRTELPSDDSLRKLDELGFTTIVVNHVESEPGFPGAFYRRRLHAKYESFASQRRRHGYRLEKLFGNSSFSAYQITPPDVPRDGAGG